MAEIFRKELNKDDITNIKRRLPIPGAPDVLAAAFRTPPGSSQARDVKVRDDETGEVYTFSYGIKSAAKPRPGFEGEWNRFARTKNFKDGDTIVLYRADESDRESGAEYKIEIRSRD